MKAPLMSLAVSIFIASSSLAGVTYDFAAVSTGAARGTISGSVKAEGSSIRLDVKEGDKVLFDNGSFIVSTDGGKTMSVVDPAQRNFYVLNLEQLLGSATALLQNLGPNLKLDIRNPKASVTDRGEGGMLEGFPTRKTTVTSSYEIVVDGLGQPISMNIDLTTDVWWTEKLPAAFTNFLQMQGLRTGLEAIDKIIQTQKASIKGFPLKQVTTTKMSFLGNDMTSTSTATVSNVKQATIPAAAFVVPADFAQTQSPLEKMFDR
jgi:hypothetical protein